MSNVDLLNIDLLDTHLDLLDGDIPNKYFACLHKVFKTSSRHVFQTSWRHVFKTSSKHVFKTSSRHVFKTSSRHVFKTSSRHIFKTSSRRLGRHKIVMLKTCWRRLQDVFNTNKCLPGKNRLNRFYIWVIYFLFIYGCLEIWVCFLRKAWHLAKSFK